MASLPDTAAPGLHNPGSVGYSQAAKVRSRAIVKPILKKLNSHSNSDRGSLDLDPAPAWDDQPSPLGYSTNLEYTSAFGDNAPALSPLSSSFAPSGSDGYRSVRDVSFSSSVEYPSWRGGRGKYSHGRSTSGTSHTSSVATTVSGRNGSFVHPFQQTPRTATPPLSYANSVTSIDTAVPIGRDYAAAIDEYDGSVSPLSYNKPYQTSSLTRTVNRPSPPPPYTHSLFQRPSLTSSQRSSSMSEGKQTPRQPAARSNSGSVVHLTHASTSMSGPDLTPSSLSSAFDTPLSSTAPLSSTPLTALSSSSPYTSMLSASADMNSGYLGPDNEIDTVTRQEHIREARRKFEEKERAKEEKYARQQLRKRERAEAHKCERPHAKIRKNSSKKSTATRGSSTTGSQSPLETASEKTEFDATGYDSVPTGQTPARADEVQFQRPKRRKSAKHKTTGVWTAFVLWFRTRLLKMGRH